MPSAFSMISPAAGPTRDFLTPLRNAALVSIERVRQVRLNAQVGRQNTVFSPRVLFTNVEIQTGATSDAGNFENEKPERKTQLEKEIGPETGKQKSSAEMKTAEEAPKTVITSAKRPFPGEEVGSTDVEEEEAAQEEQNAPAAEEGSNPAQGMGKKRRRKARKERDKRRKREDSE